jgi:hypothetical protein
VLGDPAGAGQGGVYGRVDLHVVDDADVHGGRLLHGHAGDAIGPGFLAAGRHQRIAVHASPEHVQVIEQGPHALLSGAAGQQRLVQDQARSLAGHDRQPLVPGVLDGPERGPYGHGAVWFEHQPGPGIVAPAGERLDQHIHPEREPRLREYLLQGAGDRALARTGAAVQHDHLGHGVPPRSSPGPLEPGGKTEAISRSSPFYFCRDRHPTPTSTSRSMSRE